VPALLGTVDPDDDPPGVIETAMEGSKERRVIVKPVRGIGGRDVFAVQAGRHGSVVYPGSGEPFPLETLKLADRALIQERVCQHPAMTAIYAEAVNTIRVETLLTRDREVVLLGAAVRFGRSGSRVDNVSAGGIGVGVDKHSGTLMRLGRDFGGRVFESHPDTGVSFEGYPIPHWDQVVGLLARAQGHFPFFRLLGFDVAIGVDGPLIIEVNSIPDNVGLEGSQGPILADPRVVMEFDRYGLLINGPSRALARRLRMAGGVRRAVEE
jgi:hypothetical protein